MNLPDSQKGIISWFARNPVAANLLMFAIIIGGLVSATGLRKEGFPSTEPDTITIDVSFASGSAQQAEEGVALKIEESLEGLTGIEKITSTASTSGVQVTVKKESRQDLDELLSDVKIRVDAIISLPSRAERPVITRQIREDHAIWVQLYGESDRETLQKLAREMRQDLLSYGEIQKVTTVGNRNPEIVIEVDEGRLQSYDLTLADINRIVSRESLTEISGALRSENGTISLKADRLAYRYQDFADIVVLTRPNGSSVRLGDIATIRDSFDSSSRVWMRFNGRPSIGLKLETTPTFDINAAVEQANVVVNKWQNSGRLPDNLNVSTWYDESEKIKSRLDLLIRNGLLGVLLVIAVLALFLNLRVALWVGLGLPVCFAGTLLLMDYGLLNMSLNALTTFGFIIALGIVVDDAVVIGESIYTTRQQEGDSIDSTVKGTKRVAIPTIFGVLTTVAAFGPLALVEGRMGQLFSQFTIIVVLCLLFSIVESKLILPAHLAHIDTRSKPKNRTGIAAQWTKIQQQFSNGLERFKSRVYFPALRVALRNRYLSLFGFIGILLFSLALVAGGTVRLVFFPDVPNEVINASVVVEEEVGYGLTERYANALERGIYNADFALMEKYGLNKSLIAHVQAQVTNDTSAEVTVELIPQTERTVTAAEISNAWRDHVGQLEAARALKFISSNDGPEDLRIELLSNDDSQLIDAGNRLTDYLKSTVGVRDIENNLKPGQPQIQLQLTEQGRALGLTMADLAEQIQQAFFGYEVQRVQRGKEEVKVRIRYPESQRRDISSLDKARIRTPQGDVVPLRLVATLYEGYAVSEVTRLKGKRACIITADVDKDITSPNDIVANLEANLFSSLKHDFPGLSIQLDGEAEQRAETTASMIKIFGLIMLLIFTLLAIPLKSYIQPLLIMSAIPFGLVGAILGHLITDQAISLLSIFGILALSGVVVNDSLILVTCYNQLRAEGIDKEDALIEAGGSRLRAILLTSLTTFVGLAPLLQEKSEQAQFLIPTATSLSYGILFATLITLLLIPVVISIYEDFKAMLVTRKVGEQLA